MHAVYDKMDEEKSSATAINVNIDINIIILLFGFLLIVTLLASFTAGLAFLHKKELQATQNYIGSMAFILSEQTSLAFHEIDTVIKESRNYIHCKNNPVTSEKSLHIKLHHIFEGFLQGQALLMFGPDGKMLAHSREFPTPRVNVRDRAYFKAHATHAEDSLYISRPLQNRVNGNWMISVSRRMSTPEGAFDGVVMAAIEMNYFKRLYRSLDLPSDVTIQLTRKDGTLLATYPIDDARLGTVASPGAAPSDAISASRTVSDLPLLVSITMPRKAALHRWYGLLWILCPGALAACVGIAVLTKILMYLVTKDRRQALEQKKQLEQQIHERTLSLQDILEFNKKIIDASPVGIAAYQADGQCVSANDVFSRTIDIDKSQLQEQPLDSLHILAPSGLLDRAQKTLRTGVTSNTEGSFHTASGKEIWINYQIVRFSRKQIPHLLLLVSDITERRRMEEDLRTLAFTDSLTGVNNRRRFFALAGKELERTRRTNRPFCCLSLDIDHFKRINDAHGHDQGDIALKRLADVCVEELRTNDIFGRIGGEEFSAILVETDMDAAMQVAERLRKHVERQSLPTGTTPITFTVSIGISRWQGPEDTIDSIMQRADKALYTAKNMGRNRVEKG